MGGPHPRKALKLRVVEVVNGSVLGGGAGGPRGRQGWAAESHTGASRASPLGQSPLAMDLQQCDTLDRVTRARCLGSNRSPSLRRPLKHSTLTDHDLVDLLDLTSCTQGHRVLDHHQHNHTTIHHRATHQPSHDYILAICTHPVAALIGCTQSLAECSALLTPPCRYRCRCQESAARIRPRLRIPERVAT